MKMAKEKKEQIGKGNKVGGGSSSSSSKNKQCDEESQCAVPITGHKNHKWKDCNCGCHWKKDVEDGKETKINANKDNKKEIGKKMIKKMYDMVKLTEEHTSCMNQQAHFDKPFRNESESEDNAEFLMTEKTFDVNLHPEVVLAVSICSGSKH